MIQQNMLQFMQKAKQLQVFGFTSYQNLVAEQGFEKADEILSYLLELTKIGFTLNDLNTLFKSLKTNSDTLSSPVQEETVTNFPSESKEVPPPSIEETPILDLWTLIQQRLGISFDIEKFYQQYQSPSFSGLDVEEFLLCCGCSPEQAALRMRRGKIQNKLSNLFDTNTEEYSNTTANPTRRKIFPKTPKVLEQMLILNRHFFETEFKREAPFKVNIEEYLNHRFVLTIGGLVEKWNLPEETYNRVNKEVNTLLIKYNISNEHISKSFMSGDDFGRQDSLDISLGFCELVYRDSLYNAYSKEIGFLDFVKDYCRSKGVAYTTDLITQIEKIVETVKVNDAEVQIVYKRIRPFHCLVVLHIIEKILLAERGNLVMLPLL